MADWRCDANVAGLRVFNDRGELVIEHITPWRSADTAPLNEEVLAWVDPGDDDFSSDRRLRIVSCTGESWDDWGCTKRYGWKLLRWMPLPETPDDDELDERSEQTQT